MHTQNEEFNNGNVSQAMRCVSQLFVETVSSGDKHIVVLYKNVPVHRYPRIPYILPEGPEAHTLVRFGERLAG